MSGENGCMTIQQFSTNKRVLFFDQIKALMIALVISVHVLLAFGDLGWIGVHVPGGGPADPFFFSCIRLVYLCLPNLLHVYVVSGLGLLRPPFGT